MKQLSLSQPHVIILVGTPGSGKTFFAEKFAQTFNAPYAGREKITALIPEIDSKLADALVLSQLDELLKTKQSVIVEGPAETRSERLDLARRARKAGYETLLVWVQTDPATARGRALKNPNLGEAAYEQQLQRFVPPVSPEKPVVISGKHTYATQAKVVLKKLSSRRADISSHASPPLRPAAPGRRNITIR